MKKKKKIVIKIEGGVVHEVKGLPKGIDLEIRDYDTEGVESDRIKFDKDGDEYIEINY